MTDNSIYDSIRKIMDEQWEDADTHPWEEAVPKSDESFPDGLPPLPQENGNWMHAENNPIHGIDFASVNWDGTIYEFNQSQAACVKVLWQHWEKGTPIVGESAIQEAAEVNTPLRSIFRDHPAWKTMIIQAKTKGRYQLNDLSHE